MPTINIIIQTKDNNYNNYNSDGINNKNQQD